MLHRTSLLLVTAVLEAATGLTLLVLPSLLLKLLLGVDQAAPEALFISRVAGAALLAIGVTCYLARNDKHSPAQTGVVTGALTYNVAIAALLVYSGTVLAMSGIALWPVVVLHAALALWCLSCIRGSPL
jgi:hypothetical protein